MKKLVLASLALASLVIPANSSWALGHRRGGCNEPCENTCAPACAGAPSCGQVSVTYEEREVTRYKPEWHEREVEVTVNKLEQREVVEKHDVVVCKPVWTDQKQTRTV